MSNGLEEGEQRSGEESGSREGAISGVNSERGFGTEVGGERAEGGGEAVCEKGAGRGSEEGRERDKSRRDEGETDLHGSQTVERARRKRERALSVE